MEENLTSLVIKIIYINFANDLKKEFKEAIHKKTRTFVT
jgi:hypothetical protein